MERAAQVGEAMVNEQQRVVNVDGRVKAEAKDVLVHQHGDAAAVFGTAFIVVTASNTRAIRGQRIAELIDDEWT